jgi:hypothetical protein
MEEIIGVINNLSGHTYDILYDVIFTNERVVANLIQSPLEIARPTSTWTFIIGNWFSGQRDKRELAKISEERRKKLETLNLSEIISANPENFTLNYSDIENVEIKYSMFEYRLVFHLNGSGGKKRSREFTLKKPQLDQVREMVSRTPLQKIKES